MSNPNRPFYVREITRKIDEQINSVRRELANLLSIGIITSDNTNNRLYYEVNQKYQYHDALAAIFAGKKIKAANSTKKSSKKKEVVAEAEEKIGTGEASVNENPITKQLRKTGNVSLLILSGQFTRDTSSGVDILIVGDVNLVQVEKEIAEIEKSEKKELIFAVFKPDEFIYRKQIHDRFITNALDAKHQVLINTDGLL